MNMRKYIFSLLVLICQTAYAGKTIPNKEFETEAKVIMLNNDTLYGTTIIDTKYKWNDFKGSDISNNFFFKENGKQNSIKIRPKKVKGFLIRTADSTWAIFLSSTQFNFDSDENGYLSGKYFLLKVVDGRMDVYHIYRINPGANLGNGASSPEWSELVKVLYIKSVPKVYHTEIYEAWQSKLLKFADDCPGLVAELKAVKCGWSFLQIAEYYNSKCKM